MEEINDPGPDVTTLDVDEQLTYADIPIDTLRVIRFFLEELKPVDTADIEPNDCDCAICTETFTTDSHRAVRLPCNHIFGKGCIELWLRPYASLIVMEEDDSLERALSLGANTCPLCRRVFFPTQTVVDNLTVIEMRVKFWDMAYQHVGIPLSENERRAREDFLRYLGRYHARDMDIYYPFILVGRFWVRFPGWPQTRLLAFSLRLQHRSLTPEQESLRQRLEFYARFGFPGGVRWWRNDQDELFFAVGPGNDQDEAFIPVGSEDEEDDEGEDVDTMDSEQEDETSADDDPDL